MPAFSHFFLKRLSARSKFSSSWIMTSDKFYFPPSWRLCAGMGQTVKPRRRRGMGQAKNLHFLVGLPRPECESLPVRRRRSSPAPGDTLADHPQRCKVEGLARGPGHRPPAEQVKVEVINALTSILTRVDHSAITGLGDLLLPRDRRGE